MWYISVHTYIKQFCACAEQILGVHFKNYESPMEAHDHPECDESDFISPTATTYYQMLCGAGQWRVNLGHFDIQFAIVTLSRFTIAPREGHMRRLLRTFGYLKNHSKSRITIDIGLPNLDGFQYEMFDWTMQYPDATEELPTDAPEIVISKGKCHITVIVDADNSHDLESRHSQTGCFIIINKTIIRSYSKRQSTVQTSTFSSEIVAARIAADTIVEFQYKLRMLGVEINKPSILMMDNQSIITNTMYPSSPLQKKIYAMAYHCI